MTVALLLDNTVLCNFAGVGRLDLLESLLRGRGRWTEAVAYEAERSSRWLTDLRELLAGDWLGEPIEIDDPTDVDRVERIRRSVFGGTMDEPLKHLGEAQSTYLLQHDPALAGARWVSDDRVAVDYARRQGLLVWETQDLLWDGVAMAELTQAAASNILRGMAQRGQSSPPGFA